MLRDYDASTLIRLHLGTICQRRKSWTTEIITAIALKLKDLNLTVQQCVQKTAFHSHPPIVLI